MGGFRLGSSPWVQKAIWRGLIGTLTLIPHESSFRVHEIEGLCSFHALRRMIVMIGFACGMVKHFGGPFVKQQGIRQFVGHQGTSDACACCIAPRTTS